MYRNHMQNKFCNCKDNCMEENNNLFSDICENVKNCSSKCYNECECGFEEEENMIFPKNPMFGQSYVPWQIMNETFRPEVGLRMGTIFPELVSPYAIDQAQEEMEFIAARNTIGEGCNRW